MQASSSSSGRGMPMPMSPPPPPHHHHHFYHHRQRHPDFRHATGASTPAAAAAAAAAAAEATAAANAAADSSDAWDLDNVAYVGMEYSNTGACSQKPPPASSSLTSSFRLGGGAGGCSQTKAAFLNLHSDGRGLGGGYHGAMAFPSSSCGRFGTGTSAGSSSSSSARPVYSALTPPAPTSSPEALSSVPREADYCQDEGCSSEALRVGGHYPGVLCEPHLRDGMERVAHNDKLYRTHRPSPRPEDVARPIYESKTQTDPITGAVASAAVASPAIGELLEVKKEATTAAAPPLSGIKLELSSEVKEEHVNQHSVPEATGATVAADWPGTGHCEVLGCEKSPRYGHGEEPPVVCQNHKKAGMFTVRDGKMMMATRDGSAMKKEEAIEAAPISTAQVAPEAERADAAAAGTATAAKAVVKRKAKRAGKRERLGSRCPDDDAAWTPSTANSRLQPMYRKLCEVAGCQVQPSYGPPGTTRPRFCCEHKLEGMVGLKNRPCLFPGCPTRPHYGLPNGRATYCSNHKKDGMVHLLKETKTMIKERVARIRELSRKTVAERKLMEAAKISSRYKAAFPSTSDGGGGGGGSYGDNKDYPYDNANGDDSYDQEGSGGGSGDGGWTDDSEVGARKRRRTSSSSPASSNNNGQEKGGCSRPRGFSGSGTDDTGSGGSRGGGTKKSKKGGGGGGVRSGRLPGPDLTLGSGTFAWKSVVSGWWSPDENEETDGEDVDNDNGNVSGSSRRSRPADGSGMVPSVEMRLVQEAREAARAAAEASGSGRRARAPSRKLLEASGVLENEGAQWMTKEIKEADLKIKKELREQRKHFRAAGLRAGEVIEVVEATKPMLQAPSGVVADGSGTEDGDDSTAAAAAAAAAAESEASACANSRKNKGRVTVLEAMSAFSRANRVVRSADAEDENVPQARAWLASEGGGRNRSGGGGSGGGTGGAESTAAAAVAVATAVNADTSSGVTLGNPNRDQNSDGTRRDDEKTDSETAGGSAAVEGDTRKARDSGGSRGCVAGDGEAGGGGAGGGAGHNTCEFGDCPRTASFGVNGIVRYCKSHRLFGMTEIPQNR